VTEAPPRSYDLTGPDYDHDHEGPPRRTVLLCSLRRSGSTLLGEALHATGRLGCPLEYFFAGMRPGIAERWAAPDLDGYVRALYRYRTDAGGTLGVKLFWPDLLGLCAESWPDRAERYRINLETAPAADAERVYADVARIVTELFPNPSVVLLWRRDVLRQAVSDVVAQQTGRWREVPGSTGQPVGEPVYDREAIDRRLGQVVYEQARWRDFLARLGSRSGLPFAELAYEDLVRDWDGVLGPLLAGLVGDGFDGVVPAPRLRRQSDARTERILLRYLEDRRAGSRALILAAR
jgi:trehalose 2-sulfotransferase